MMVIMMAITKKIALINVIEDNPNAVEMSVPPMAEPNAIPILKAEIFKTEETSSVPGRYFSESWMRYNCIPGTVAKPIKPIAATKRSAGIL